MEETMVQENPFRKPAAPAAPAAEVVENVPEQAKVVEEKPQPMPQPVAQPMPQPVAQPMPQPVAQPMPQPVAQPQGGQVVPANSAVSSPMPPPVKSVPLNTITDVTFDSEIKMDS
jgi:hypothetical protein